MAVHQVSGNVETHAKDMESNVNVGDWSFITQTIFGAVTQRLAR